MRSQGQMAPHGGATWWLGRPSREAFVSMCRSARHGRILSQALNCLLDKHPPNTCLRTRGQVQGHRPSCLLPRPQVCFNMGQMVLAKKMLRKALRLLNRVFPYNLISLFLQTHVEKNRHFYYLNQQAQESSPPG